MMIVQKGTSVLKEILWLISRRDSETEEDCQLCTKNLIVQELTIKFFMYNSNCLLHLCLHLQFAVFFREKLMKNLQPSPILYFPIIIYLFSVEEGGVTAEPLENEKVSQLCLSEEEALALGQLGVQLEQMFGGPRDIEWALSKVSNLLLFVS